MAMLDRIASLARGARGRFGLALFWFAALFLWCAAGEFADLPAKNPAGFALAAAGAFSAACALFFERRPDAAEFAKLAFPASAAAAALAFCLFSFARLPGIVRMEGTGLVLALSAVSLFLLARDGARGVFPRCFLAAAKAIGLTAAAAAAVFFCLWAANALLFTVPAEAGAVAGHFLFCFALPALALSFLPLGTETDAPRALELFLLRLVLPAGLALLAILIAYLAKILILGKVPSGEVNWFASFALLGYAFLWFTLRASENERVKRFLRFAPLLLLPVVALQLWCVWIRLSAYGLTGPRMMSLAATFFGILVMAAGAAGRGERALCLAAAAMLILFTATPLNFIDAPLRSQEARAVAVLKARSMIAPDGTLTAGDPLSARDREVLVGAMRYLRHEGGLMKRDPADLTAESRILASLAKSPLMAELEKQEDAEADSVARAESRFWDGEFSVEGYSRMTRFSGLAGKGKIKVTMGGQELEFQAKDALEKFLAPEARKDESMVFEPDARHRFVFTSVSRSGEDSYSVIGYLLARQSP